MSNGDRIKQHMVVNSTNGRKMLCFTDKNEPAVYADAPAAELFAAQLRKRFPDAEFTVISFEVL